MSLFEEPYAGNLQVRFRERRGEQSPRLLDKNIKNKEVKKLHLLKNIIKTIICDTKG